MTAPPRMRVVAVLLAGRGTFRATVVLSAPVLLALWGKEGFAPYAVAVGITLVLSPLVGSGAEKSAGLLLAPGARDAAGADPEDRRRLVAAHLGVVLTIAVVSLIVAAVLVPRLSGPAGLYLLAAATNVGFGAVQALVGYWRVLGRPYVDAVCHALLALTTGLGVALAALADAGPQVVLGLQAGVALSIATGLGVALLTRAARPGRSELARTARTTLLMGANTLVATAALSLVFALLAQRGLTTAASHLYLAVVVYTVLANLLDYLLRVFQPWLATSLLDGSPRIVRQAEHGARFVLIVVVPLSAGTVLLLSNSMTGVAQAFVSIAAVAPALLAVAGLVWVLENLDSATLIGTVFAGVVGLTGTAAVGSLLLSSSAVTGSALALLGGAALTMVALLPILRRRLPASHPQNPLIHSPGRHP